MAFIGELLLSVGMALKGETGDLTPAAFNSSDAGWKAKGSSVGTWNIKVEVGKSQLRMPYRIRQLFAFPHPLRLMCECAA
jgi:hypothetical protein